MKFIAKHMRFLVVALGLAGAATGTIATAHADYYWHHRHWHHRQWVEHNHHGYYRYY